MSSFRSLISLALLAAACGETGDRSLPKAPEPYRSIDNTVVLELADSGGFVINGQAIGRDELPDVLRLAYKPLPPASRALFVRVGPSRDWHDVEYVRQAAAAQEIPLFGFEETWPELRGAQTVHADSVQGHGS